MGIPALPQEHEEKDRGRMLTALLRYGGRVGHFLEQMVPMDNIVDGIQKWVELQDLVTEAGLGA
jgi:hypothetical protein